MITGRSRPRRGDRRAAPGTRRTPDPAGAPAVSTPGGAAPGPDGLLRCPGIRGLHRLPRHQWGQPVRSDAGIFERLSLEAFQSGLSWLTILRKRENFRAAFAGWIRRSSPRSARRTRRACWPARNRAEPGEDPRGDRQRARRPGGAPAGFAALIWRYADPRQPPPLTLADVPAQTPASLACARELRKLGFSFVGPVTVYAALQACGVVDDRPRRLLPTQRQREPRPRDARLAWILPSRARPAYYDYYLGGGDDEFDKIARRGGAAAEPPRAQRRGMGKPGISPAGGHLAGRQGGPAAVHRHRAQATTVGNTHQVVQRVDPDHPGGLRRHRPDGGGPVRAAAGRHAERRHRSPPPTSATRTPCSATPRFAR